MSIIKIRIDFNSDPSLNKNSKQVVYLEKTLDEIDIRNLIGKKIINAEYETFHNCIVLSLDEEMPEITSDIIEHKE